MSIEFPFVEVSDIELAFPVLRNHDEVVGACPEEFWQESPYSAIADKWFSRGLDPETDLAEFELKEESPENINMKVRNVRAWLTSYEPKHQDKIAVASWMLSLILQPVAPEK